MIETEQNPEGALLDKKQNKMAPFPVYRKKKERKKNKRLQSLLRLEDSSSY